MRFVDGMTDACFNGRPISKDSGKCALTFQSKFVADFTGCHIALAEPLSALRQQNHMTVIHLGVDCDIPR